ncbi:two-component regulator propeller domain-containing protein [soil metagenome]
MKPLLLTIFSFFLLKLTILQAQTDLRFEHLSTQDGLSHNAVLSIHQDKEGFMWFGTEDGLNKYDGYTFKHYKADPKDPGNTLYSNYIYDLFEDSKGRFWVGCHGLNLLNKKNDKFTTYLPDSSRFNYLNISLSILEDKQGMLWYSAGGGLNRFDPESEIFTSYYTSELTPNFGLIEDQNGKFWMGSGAGLYQFNPKSEELTSFPLNHEDNPRPVIKALKIDSDGVLWIGTAGAGIFKINTRDISAHSKEYNPVNLVNPSISNNGIIEDKSGNIWLATTEGLQRIDKKNNQVSTFRANPAIPGTLSSNYIISIYQDREGTLWIGTDNGINKLVTYSKPFYSYQISKHTHSIRLEENKINSLLADEKGMVWLGTVKGLYKFNPNKNQFSYLPHNSNKSKNDTTSGEISDDLSINVIKEDNSGRLWLGTYSGLYFLNQKGVFTHFPCKIGIQFMDMDPSGKIWIPGGDHKNGNAVMAVFDTENLKFSYTEYGINDTAGLKDGYMHGIFASSSGNIWVAAGMWGISFRDPLTGKFTHYLPNPDMPGSMIENDLLCIYEDKNGIVWAGTRMGGLYRFDPKTGKFSNFTTYDGLISNLITSITEDEKGKLWLGTNNGLSCFDPVNKNFKNFDKNDGLPDNEFRMSASYSRNGIMYFGTGNGFVKFNPDSIQIKSGTPPVYITNIKVLENKLDLPEDRIELKYFENFISFDFTALDFNATDKIQYAYKLENFNKDWIQSDKRRYAAYTNLDPGEYVFRVKASNSDGLWNENGASLSIIIHPPWWQTGWAYIFYFILAIYLLYSFRQYTLNRERLKNDLKIRQIEADKLHQLEETRSRFFANISHEFRTPLTLILGPLEKLLSVQEENANHPLYLMMERNARRLLNLINQILDLSKLESGSLKLEAKTDNITIYLKILAASFTSLAQSRNINFTTIFPINGYEVSFDKDKLEKIVVNLLSNAFKFTPEGGAIKFATDIKIDTTKNSSFLEITVEDNGMGLEKGEIKKIFNRFYKVENLRSGEIEGTGIGLALTKELVDLHQGTINVTSEPGMGTIFKVIIPLDMGESRLLPDILPENSIEIKKVVSGVSKGTINEAKSLETENDLQVEKPILLIVEDNQELSGYIASHFKPQFQIIEALNGKTGFQQALKTIPDLIISDVMMPVMDGLELCKKLKTDVRTSHIPIILLTAKAGDENKIEGLENGADEYLAKPFKGTELKARVNNIIEGRKRLREKYSREIKLQPAEIAITSADEKFLEQVMAVLEANYMEATFTIEFFEKEVGLSRTQFYRKMKALTDQSPGEFIRNFRLQKAVMLLKGGQGNITEIAYSVGFNSLTYFTRCFKEFYGKPPSEFLATQSASESI